eukprot:scaffold14107_cov124-Isochrysis_galbana.AAC.4
MPHYARPLLPEEANSLPLDTHVQRRLDNQRGEVPAMQRDASHGHPCWRAQRRTSSSPSRAAKRQTRVPAGPRGNIKGP